MNRTQLLEISKESTCLKRVTLCVLYDESGRFLAAASNRCDPPGGKCQRVGISQQKESYAIESCNWTHAEIRAIEALPQGSRPKAAFLYGHDFICDSCENALRKVGVDSFTVVGEKYGAGLRREALAS